MPKEVVSLTLVEDHRAARLRVERASWGQEYPCKT